MKPLKLRQIIGLVIFACLANSCGKNESLLKSATTHYREDSIPLNYKGKTELTFDTSSGFSQLFRLAVYSKATLQISVVSGESIEMHLEGPLNKNTDTLPFNPNSRRTIHHSQIFDLETGAYRITFYNQNKKPSVINISCNGCEIPILDLKEFNKSFKDEYSSFINILKDYLNSSGQSNSSLTELISTLSTKNIPERFPVVSLQIGDYVDLIHQWQKSRQIENAKKENFNHPYKNMEVNDLFKDCNQPYRSELVEFDSQNYPGWYYDYPADWTIRPCVADHSPKLANILTTIATSNDHGLRFNGNLITSVKHFFELLVESGHEIELRNERMHADFLAFAYKGQWLQWPLWVDIGFQNPRTGLNIQVPMGHSQHSFLVRGKMIDASVSYFLGMYGAGYFPNLSKRSEWTGFKTLYSIKDKEAVLYAAQLSQEFIQKLKADVVQHQVGPFDDGYVMLGVCNDSSGVIEIALQHYYNFQTRENQALVGFSFPYLRRPQFDNFNFNINQHQTGILTIDQTLSLLPRDTDPINGSESQKKSMFCRALAMDPFEANQNILGARMKSDIEYMRSVVGSGCPKILGSK